MGRNEEYQQHLERLHTEIRRLAESARLSGVDAHFRQYKIDTLKRKEAMLRDKQDRAGRAQ